MILVLLPNHRVENRIAKRVRHSAVSQRRCTGVDPRKAIRHFRPHRVGAVTAVRIAHDENLVRIYVTEEQKLFNQVCHERIGVAGVKSIPGVVRRAQRDIDVATHFWMVAVIGPHPLPLAVIELLCRAAAAMHRNEQSPTFCGTCPNRLYDVGTHMIFKSDFVLRKTLTQISVIRGGPEYFPHDLADSRLVTANQLFLRRRKFPFGLLLSTSIEVISESDLEFRFILLCQHL